MYDVILIGGGQAGLSLGYYLHSLSLSYKILEKNSRVGDSWRHRYDSLVLFTPRDFSSLPGKKLEGVNEGFPTKDEVANYLEEYARDFNLKVQTDTFVTNITKKSDYFRIETNGEILQSKTVVMANGPFQKPYVPEEISSLISTQIQQIHTANYKNPTQIQGTKVLVVGAGNSGVQIAIELSEKFSTTLSVGKKMKLAPSIIMGKSIFWWFDKLKIARATKDSLVGKVLRKNDPIIGKEIKPYIRKNIIKTQARTVDFNGDTAVFSNGETLKPDCVLWATGFKDDFSMIDIPQLFDKGTIPHERGVTNVEGFFLLGRSWQYRRGSALLLGVGEDAEFIANKIKSKVE